MCAGSAGFCASRAAHAELSRPLAGCLPCCSAPSVSYGSTNLYLRGALEEQTRHNLEKVRRPRW